MSRKQQPLPEYQSLVRWSVQDVVNWLSQNNMSECMKSFRHGGVDGNKLVNVTATDLNNINCPRRHIQDILYLVSQVVKPGMQVKRGAPGWKQAAPKLPPNEQTFRQLPQSRSAPSHSRADSASGSEDEMWDDDEWDQDYSSDESYEDPVDVSQQPIAPARPSRDLPRVPASRPAPPISKPPKVIQQDSAEEFYEDPDLHPEEFQPPPPRRAPAPVPVPDIDDDAENYEDPDKTVKVQNFHAGPLPTPPVATPARRNVPVGGKRIMLLASEPSLPPRPSQTPARAPVPVPVPVPEPDAGEDYEEPDVKLKPARPVPPSISSVPTKSKPPPPTVIQDQEDYEEPDLKPLPPPISSVPSMRGKPGTVTEENYDEPDKPRPPLPIGQRKPPPPPIDTMQSSRTNIAPPAPRNVPTRKPSNEPVVQELYEVPDATADEEGENYLAMDEGDAFMEKDAENYLEIEEAEPVEFCMQAPVSSSVSIPKPSSIVPPRRPAMPLPTRDKMPDPMLSSRKPAVQPALQDDGQETYEVPDEDTSTKVAPAKKLSNGSARVGHSHRPERALPLPPQEVPKPAFSAPEPEPKISREFTEADLMRQKWYHGPITRQEGDRLLNQYCEDGMYLIRKSSQGGDKPYTLQIYYERKIYNLPIRTKVGGVFALGKDEKLGEKTFDTLLKLVNAFKKNTIVLAGGKQTKLVKSLPKS